MILGELLCKCRCYCGRGNGGGGGSSGSSAGSCIFADVAKVSHGSADEDYCSDGGDGGCHGDFDCGGCDA